MPTAPPTAAAPTARGAVVTGTVTGIVEISTDVVEGSRMPLVGLVGVGCLALALWSLGSTGLTIIAVYLTIPFMIFAVLTSGGSMAGFVASLTGSMFRAGMAASRSVSNAATNATQPRGPQMFEVRRFRVVDAQRQGHDCVLEGIIVGGTLRSGDDVEVHGRRRRHGEINVDGLLIVASGATVRGRLPFALKVMRMRRRIMPILLGLGAAAAAIALSMR